MGRQWLDLPSIPLKSSLAIEVYARGRPHRDLCAHYRVGAQNQGLKDVSDFCFKEKSCYILLYPGSEGVSELLEAVQQYKPPG